MVSAKMYLMTSASLAAVSILLCGCSLMEPNKPEALDMGGGRYSVTGATLSTNITSARQDAAAQASAFYVHFTRHAVIENYNDSAQGGHLGGPTSSAVF